MFAGFHNLVKGAKQLALVGRRSFPKHHADKGYEDTTAALILMTFGPCLFAANDKLLTIASTRPTTACSELVSPSQA